MEENTQPCDTCGGLNFELNLGYYHCTECQTRRADIQKHEIEEFDHKLTGLLNTKTTVKQQTEEVDKVKLTTWECYNYVIKGLIEELLVLGADMLLRSVVKKLWFKYLLKLEVVNLEKPKLQAVNTKVDAEILYGKSSKKKRKKRRKTSNADASSMRGFRKKKKLLYTSQHDYTMSKSVSDSMMDETLETLVSQSQKSSQSSIPLKFNKYAEMELKRRQSNSHLEKHSVDFDNNLLCHRNSYSEATKIYQNSSHLLSINKIYSLLYLGLLLTKSKIQLADMLRFIREGHISFNSFKHFFPEEMNDNFLTQICPRKTSFTSASLRESAFQMAQFLNVLDFMQVQNLAMLIERFCTELNLPRQIEKRTLSCLVNTLPQMKITEKSKLVPNYEARAMSLIMFQIKLFFMCDGKTEKYLSNSAVVLNNEQEELKMFDFMEWLQYIEYRKHALDKFHFPTEFASSKQIKNCDNFLKFLISKNPEYELWDISKKKNKVGQDCQQLLLKLKDRQFRIEESTYMEPSFTPSRDYIKSFLQDKIINGEVEQTILARNFEECSLDFILNPSKYVQNILSKEKKIRVKLEGANKNIKQHKLTNIETERSRKLKQDRKFRIVKVGTTLLDKHKTSKNSTVVKSEKYTHIFEDYHRSSERIEELEKQLNSSVSNQPEEGEKTFIHLIPHERYWVNTHYNLGYLSKETFEEHFDTYPYNFQLVLKEMARICEQSKQELLEEFTLTEIYLLYGETYQTMGNENVDMIHNDNLMKKILSKAISHW